MHGVAIPYSALVAPHVGPSEGGAPSEAAAVFLIGFPGGATAADVEALAAPGAAEDTAGAAAKAAPRRCEGATTAAEAGFVADMRGGWCVLWPAPRPGPQCREGARAGGAAETAEATKAVAPAEAAEAVNAAAEAACADLVRRLDGARWHGSVLVAMPWAEARAKLEVRSPPYLSTLPPFSP